MTLPPDQERGIALTEDQLRRRRQRNIAIGLSLFALIVLFYFVTIFKIGASVAQRSV